jgi:FkbM family methyltransferase
MTFTVSFILHRLLQYLGVDIIKRYKIPENTLLGLTKYDIHTILDIGANIGQSARFYTKIFPNALIYSFEPLPAVYSELDKWAQGQKGKVRALNFALGDHNGQMEIKEHIDFTPSSSFLESTSHLVALYPQTTRKKDTLVNITRLDDISKDLDIEPGILVKMDVQGFEAKVIEGGKSIFSQALACIMEVSLQPLYEGQPTFFDMCRLMDENGLKYSGNIQQLYDEKGRVIFLDALFTRQVTL